MTVAGLVGAAPWAVLGGVVLWYLRDRRKDRAASEVAERTVNADVTTKDVGAAEARLLYAVRAFDEERKSYERRIRDDQAEKDELRRQIDMLRREVEELQTRLGSMHDRLAELADRTDSHKERS